MAHHDERPERNSRQAFKIYWQQKKGGTRIKEHRSGGTLPQGVGHDGGYHEQQDPQRTNKKVKRGAIMEKPPRPGNLKEVMGYKT